ncbi:polymorphic outer membrane domain containing protein [Nitzschia inconspicua]|uniref:Polymorphic outer membrane domain containing protein n=1 Tax=Nitzschia inconspicua TaxID=303405 RepID=A0A9K3PP91_9STRA|nr:polymorphic outer membrane domain containing protein [Nitzschia inconspicua]
MWTNRRDVWLSLLLVVVCDTSRQLVGANLVRFPNANALNGISERVESKKNIATDLPTDSPTESPAPSPSPSEAPSNDPERITAAPSAYPTESPAPSPSPSEVPTAIPTGFPSENPSSSPSISSAPSTSPTPMPSDVPSDIPSMVPSVGPSLSAMPSEGPSKSLSPSSLPSTWPSEHPSSTPSGAPTYSPTQETQKTKSSVSEIILVNIPRRMDDLTLAEFEVATLEFIRQAQSPNKAFDLEFLAVTVLTQSVVFPDHYETKLANKTKNGGDQRSLVRVPSFVSSPWEVALELSFRVVAVVTSGRVPDDFDLEDLVMNGFEKHFNQYLWQLGNTNEFFAPLKDISDWPAQQQAAVGGEIERDSKKAAFVIAILFSLVAVGLACFASFYAIRRQLKQQGRHQHGKKGRGGSGMILSPKPKLLDYSGPDVINYLTNSTNEDSTYHDGDVEGGGAIHFVKSIDSDDQSLESVGLTPKAAKSPASRGSGFFSDEEASPLKSPDTFQSSKQENITTSGISFGLSEAQKTMKKWMTPRRSVERALNVGGTKNRFSTGSKSVRFDPPEKELGSSSRTPRKQSEPDAKSGGIYAGKEGMEIVKNTTGEDGEFTLPISFFSRESEDGESDFVGGGTPMSSLAGSNGSTFFSNIGKSFAGRRSSTGIPSSSIGISMNPTINENLAFSEASTSAGAPSTVVNERRRNSHHKGANNTTEDTKFPKREDTSSEVSDASQSSRVQSVIAQIQKRQMEAQKILSPHPVPPRKPFANPHEGFETILGARSRSMEEDDVVQNMLPGRKKENHSMTAPSSTPKSRRTYGYSFKNDSGDATRQQSPREPLTTLGARPLENHKKNVESDDNMTTLSNAMQRPGTYDVYAPSGPIGIVVDTSKDGPSVHSLKSTSPMLGLITAGDLIIALDNEDTRNLSAAELTRLMAKKSHQRERKITLYSVDGF